MKRLRLVSYPITVRRIDTIATGELARALRIEVGMSLSGLAQRMKITKMYLSDLERGRRAWRQELVDNFNNSL